MDEKTVKVEIEISEALYSAITGNYDNMYASKIYDAIRNGKVVDPSWENITLDTANKGLKKLGKEMLNYDILRGEKDAKKES